MFERGDVGVRPFQIIMLQITLFSCVFFFLALQNLIKTDRDCALILCPILEPANTFVDGGMLFFFSCPVPRMQSRRLKCLAFQSPHTCTVYNVKSNEISLLFFYFSVEGFRHLVIGFCRRASLAEYLM